MRKMEEVHGSKLVSVMLKILFGSVVALVVCLLLLLVASFGISSGLLDESLSYQLAIAGCIVGSFVGSLSAIRRVGTRTLLVGLGTSIMFFLLLLMAGILFFDNMTPGQGGVGVFFGSLCGGVAAGLLGSKPKKKRR